MSLTTFVRSGSAPESMSEQSLYSASRPGLPSTFVTGISFTIFDKESNSEGRSTKGALEGRKPLVVVMVKGSRPAGAGMAPPLGKERGLTVGEEEDHPEGRPCFDT